MNKQEQNIPDGYKQTEVGIIPKDWEVKKLGKIGQFYKGKGISKTELLDEGLNAVHYGEIYTTHHFYIKKIDSFISKESASNSYSLSTGDILFAGSGETLEEIGKSVAFLGKEETFAGSDIIILRPQKKYDSKFLGFSTNEDFYRKQIHRLGQGHSVVHIYPSNLLGTVLPIPQLPEQKEIADCLTTWDTAIEKLTLLIDLKNRAKKGLMQQLLTGKKRLPGFTEKWQEVRLGNLGQTFNGLTGKNKDDFGKGFPYVSYLNTFRNNKIDESTEFDYVEIKESENQNTLKYGDLIFTTSSETPNEVGISSVVLFKPKDNLYLNSFCFALRLKDFSILAPRFAVFLLRGQDLRKSMYKLAQGSTRFNLSKTGFKKIKVTLPSIKEQTAIADILQTADKEIDLLEDKLKAIETQKKGLMQVLLTGKKRLI